MVGTRDLATETGDLIKQTGRPVILVVNNSAAIRNTVTNVMEDDGYLVLTAADGDEALESSRRYRGAIDVAIFDVTILRLHSTDLCAHLLAVRPGIKVLVLSGSRPDGLGDPRAGTQAAPGSSDSDILRSKVREILHTPATSWSFVHMVFCERVQTIRAFPNRMPSAFSVL